MTTTETADRTDGIGIPARPRGDLLAAMMGLTTCLLPFLVPAGPGNTGGTRDATRGAEFTVPKQGDTHGGNRTTAR